MSLAAADLSCLEALLDRANRGNSEARAALIESSCQRLRKLSRRMLHFHYGKLRRWEDTDDVLQLAMIRLDRALKKTKPKSLRDFYGLAARQIRWELTDLCRRHFGPQGIGVNHESDFGGGPASESAGANNERSAGTDGPATLMSWSEFHEQAGTMPDDEREAFDLLWYQQLSQEDAAAVIGVSVRTVKRRWQRAKLWLFKASGGRRPGCHG